MHNAAPHWQQLLLLLFHEPDVLHRCSNSPGENCSVRSSTCACCKFQSQLPLRPYSVASIRKHRDEKQNGMSRKLLAGMRGEVSISHHLTHAFESTRCLVLGGGGFIGINLSNALAHAGAHVHAYGRSITIPGALSPSIRWSAADFSDRQNLAAAIETADYVFHLASSSTPANANVDPIADVKTNLIATLGMLELFRNWPARRLIFVSSGGTVYGPSDETPIPETAPTNPISAHGIHKVAIEKYLALYRHLYGLDYIVLRVSNPYGPMQLARKNQGVIAAFIQRALANEPIEIWGNGESIRDFIYVDDVVAALMSAALHKGTSRLFNVGSGVGMSVNSIVDSLERALKRGQLRRIHHKSRLVDVSVNVLDIQLIEEEMGWSPRVSWDVGLPKTISWMRRFRSNFEAGAPQKSP